MNLMKKLPEVIQVNVLKDKIEKKPPPPPPPEMKAPPPPFVPPPDIVIQTEAPPPVNTITTQSKVATPPPKLSAPFTIGRPHQCMDQYPPISVRLGETGVTTLGFTITAEGNTENVHIVESSGSERLDNAAVKCVQRWRYGPAKNDAGQPMPVSNRAKVQWNLK